MHQKNNLKKPKITKQLIRKLVICIIVNKYQVYCSIQSSEYVACFTCVAVSATKNLVLHGSLKIRMYCTATHACECVCIDMLTTLSDSEKAKL